MELSKTAYVILGTLALGRRTGYEIKSLVDVSVRFFWAASYGQIYPELARLEEAGLVTSTSDATDGRRRKAYELTDEGRRVLHEWIASDAPLHTELRHEGVLKLFFSDVVSREEQADVLRRIREEHERVQETLSALAPPGHSATRLVRDFGVAYQEFIADWCRRAEKGLSQQAEEPTE